MSNVVNIAEQQALDMEAATWVARIDRERLSAEEFAQFKAWVGHSKARKSAFDNAAKTWGQLEILSDLQGSVTAPELQKSWAQFFTRFFSGVRGFMPKPVYVFGAATLLLAVTLTIISGNSNRPLPESAAIYTTAIGEHKSVPLADGSQLLLNTGSQVEVLYNEESRTLKLVKGEAHFDVAHNPNRPFEVYAGTNIVRAVGTAFTVEIKAETVEVTVTEGQVELATIAPADASEDMPQERSLALVNQGQSAQFSDFIQTIDTIQEEEVARRLAWHNGALIFKGDALEDVIQEVSRYTKTRIVISDPALRHLKVGGYFKTGETQAMLDALKANFGVNVDWVGSDLVYLSQSDGDE